MFVVTGPYHVMREFTIVHSTTEWLFRSGRIPPLAHEIGGSKALPEVH